MGSVYFIKHIGLDPIKIGYSSHPNPHKRIEGFKTASPYGIEVLGFITSENAKQLETSLHGFFKDKRTNGEWFDITKEDVDRQITLRGESEFVKAKNEFIENLMFNIADPEGIDQRIIDRTCIEFDKWWSDFDMIFDFRFEKNELYSSFLNDYKHMSWVSQRKFTAWIQLACKLNGLNSIEGRSKTRWILFSK